MIFVDWPENFKDKFNKLSVFIFLFTFTYVISYGLYNILRLGPNFQMISIRNADYIFPLKHVFENILDPFRPNLIKSFGWFYIMGPGILLFIFAIGLLSSFNNYKKQFLIIFSWGVLTTLIQAEFAKVFTARYIFFSLPFIFIISAVGYKFRKYKVIKTILILIFILGSLKNDYLMIKDIENMSLPESERSGYLEEWTAGTGIKEIANYLKEKYQNDPNKKIVVGTEGYFGTLPDGLQLYLNDIPQITVIGVGIDLNAVPNSLLESKKAGNETYLVINASRLLVKPGDLGLDIISVYPKALRQEGTREYNTLGPQDKLYLFRLKKV
ncbi:hypothetical protein A2159_00530 [Candidatus Woesebacteria bacterium RBG_13_34_9]|uniref:Glycosyltransferase RgtA/B/C/D-like domain-containing protein n=1 Tax=Candidatus Woesebacteria bacterium RBG_13_34_9 TaxID=1802477 RepID=A0A1F7X7V5_9BACT|nr:MAG: hypothetical protein A2159_00530 [Candidatus Woesebacteria bacterium RBG_13_34_9]